MNERRDGENGWDGSHNPSWSNRDISSADPLIVKDQQYPELTPYQFASNSPIMMIDLDGLEGFPMTRDFAVQQLWRSTGYGHEINEAEATEIAIHASIYAASTYVEVNLMVLPVEELVGQGIVRVTAIGKFGRGGIVLNVVKASGIEEKIVYACSQEIKITKANVRYAPNPNANRKLFVEGAEQSKPYSKSRPSYADGQVDEVWERAKQADGNVYDPNTGDLLQWDKSKSRQNQWHMGHKPDKEYKKLHKDYMDGKISKEEFIKQYQDPKNYQPELPANNWSHKFEKK